MKNAKQPIYPQMYNRNGNGDDDFEPLKDGLKTGYESKMGGLTKREYFAGLAMQGFLANRWSKESIDFQGNPVAISEYAIEVADELLKHLEK